VNAVELLLVVVSLLATGTAVAAGLSARTWWQSARDDAGSIGAASTGSGTGTGTDTDTGSATARPGRRDVDVARRGRDTVVHLLADPVVVLDLQGQVTDANPAGHRFLERLDPDVRPDELLREPQELYLDGRPMQVELTVAPVHDDAGRTVGHVVVATRVDPWHRRHQELTIAHQTLLRQVEEAERRRVDLAGLAVRDALTGLSRRRDLPRALQVLCDDPLAEFALFVLDVDRLALVNQAHGHEVGDELLAGIGRVLRETTRADDTVVRFGGEEFVVVMRSVGPETVLARAEDLRAACGSVLVTAGDNPVGVTVSIGAALSGDVPRTPQALQRAADRALWTAKRAGRDRVVLYRPDDVARQAGDLPLSQRFGTGSRGRLT
jgi:diguanylate cyclase (GGDEF)-like protein